jgi:putative oxidoreductase
MFKKLMDTGSAKTTLLVRLIIGVVFLSEGIQKFLLPEVRGAGRFEKIGLPSPDFLGSFVGTFEILCGALIIVGLFTRLASIPLIIIMLVAFATTKAEILSQEGFWELLHRSRTDWAMLLGSVFLLIEGSGNWSLDEKLSKRLS